MNLIAIESSSNQCGVAYFKDDALQLLQEEELPRQQARILPVFLDKVLNSVSEIRSDLTAIAVNIGPGSYTGLRIGLSLAKGLAMALSIPVVPVNGFLILAQTCSLNGHYYIIIHSHKNLVHAQLFAGGNAVGDPRFCTIDELVDHPICGCKKDDQLIGKLNYISESPSAQLVGQLALEHFADWQVTQLHLLKPAYLTQFNIRKRP